MRGTLVILAACGLIVGACSSDPTATKEYEELELQLTQVRAELIEVTAQRDALAVTAATSDESSDRYERSLATQEAIGDILAHPEAYGSEDDVVDLLASYATADAVMDDAVFGAIGIRNAWHNTLYGGAMVAEIDTSFWWLSDDGSQGGALWLWHGTNLAGNPFQLAGIALDTFDENGSITYEYIVYPYPDEYVWEAVLGSGTAEREDDPVEVFDFETDDLCTWVSPEQVSEFVERGYGWEVVAADLFTPPSSDGWDCQWKLTGADGQFGEIDVEEADWETFGGGVYDMHRAMTEDVVDFSDLDQALIPIGATVAGHPSLGEGVLVHNGGFGQFAFGTESLDRYLQIYVIVPGEDDDWEQEEQKFLSVANDVVEALGWVP